MLAVDGITMRFGGITALDGVGFAVEQGTAVGLIGPNGAGKTTLFNCLTRRCTPDEGTVHYEGRDLLSLPPHTVAGHGIARTFQNLGLFQHLTVRENVMVGAHHRGSAGYLAAALRLPRVRREEARLRLLAEDLLQRLDLADVADHPASGLPFGTLKRVELARALAVEPRLLLLDEPSAGLSPAHQDLVFERVKGINGAGVAVLMVEQNARRCLQICHRGYVLDQGRNAYSGTGSSLLHDEKVIELYLGTLARVR